MSALCSRARGRTILYRNNIALFFSRQKTKAFVSCHENIYALLRTSQDDNLEAANRRRSGMALLHTVILAIRLL